MNTELRKRLKEAAKKSIQHQYNCKYKYHMDCEMHGGYNTPFDCCECGAGDYNKGFFAGAEYGYNEAIKVVKELLSIKGVFGGNTSGDLQQYITEFETNMNKFWEEK